MDVRGAAILRQLVELYVETGEPVGSRTLSRRLPHALSPATIRNVMADLEEAGLLFAPHTSAGRLPTERGLRLFVDGLLQFVHGRTIAVFPTGRLHVGILFDNLLENCRPRRSPPRRSCPSSRPRPSCRAAASPHR
jgi:hypothetical protein